MKRLSLLSSTVLCWSTSTAFVPGMRSTRFGRTSMRMSSDEFTVGVLGDLHIDPREMDDYEIGRKHFGPIFDKAKAKHGNAALVSLGDLGESKAVHPGSTELFSGTTECHKLAADYLKSFGVPYELVGGNHDLEGIDEFATDEANLEMFLDVHNKPTPQFKRQIADKTLLVGMTSTVFRDAEYTSHEVFIDQDQLDWFEETLKAHPASEGWKVFVFTHAPPAGSGLKVLEDNHVVNGCCWLNQSNEEMCRKYIELVREHRCIKAWFSGHFHLGQDYQDSITFPNAEDENEPDRGSCVFAQTSVMRDGTSRDGHRQSRLIRGNKDGFEICTVDHKRGGTVRLDATVTYSDCDHEVGVYASRDEEQEVPEEQFEQVYSPIDEDEVNVHLPEEERIEYDDYLLLDEDVSKDTSAWFYLACGRVLGMLNGMLIEYDPSTLAPLGLVVSADELVGKRVAVIDAGGELDCNSSSSNSGLSGVDCVDMDARDQAVVIIDDNDNSIVVVQPNEDGSYWRKIVRNKLVRMKEMRREKAAEEFAKKFLEKEDAQIISSWGPYKTTSGTAKSTGESDLIAVASLDDEQDANKKAPKIVKQVPLAGTSRIVSTRHANGVSKTSASKIPVQIP